MVNKNKGSVRQLKFIDAMGYDMKCIKMKSEVKHL